jgi:hypothetical protein
MLDTNKNNKHNHINLESDESKTGWALGVGLWFFGLENVGT